MIIKDEKAMRRLGARLAPVLRPGDAVTLSGPLSAGKTTMVRGLLEALGHRGEVPSPSFAIVQPYEELTPPIWHVDLYRIDNPADIEELGLDDIRAEGVLIVEWPEHGMQWSNALALSLELLEDGSRSLTEDVPEAWEERWPPP